LVSSVNVIGRIYPSITGLWKWSERFSLETRITPNIGRGFGWEKNYVGGRNDPHYGSETYRYPTNQWSPFANFHLGIKYSSKVIKPKRKRKK
jgi:hypothetical protein